MTFRDRLVELFSGRKESSQSGYITTIYDTDKHLLDVNVIPFNGLDDELIGYFKNYGELHPKDNFLIQSHYFENIKEFNQLNREELEVLSKQSPSTQSVRMQEFLFCHPTLSSAFIETSISHDIKQKYRDYLHFLDEKNLKDIPRSQEFFTEIIKESPECFSFIPAEDKTKALSDVALEGFPYNYHYLKEEFRNFDTFYYMIRKRDREIDLSYIIKPLPGEGDHSFPKNLTSSEFKTIFEEMSYSCISDVQYRYDDDKFSLSIEQANVLKMIPDSLHEKFNIVDIVGQDVYAFYRVTNGHEFTPEQAEQAMVLFARERFIYGWDPAGADDAFGGVTGCNYEIYRNLKNPKDYFPADTLSPQQWHSIVDINPKMINHIPQEIITRNEFWDNYESFIGKGSYPIHPRNDFKYDKFDEYEIFSKMPEVLKTEPQVYNTLLSREAVSLDFVKEKDESLYLRFGYKNYSDIPEEFRVKEAFRDIAQKAVEYDVYAIQAVPEKFITEKMAEIAVLKDVTLLDLIPKEKLSPLLLEKVTQSLPSQIQHLRSSLMHEHPDALNYEVKIRTDIIADMKKQPFIPSQNKSQQQISM